MKSKAGRKPIPPEKVERIRFLYFETKLNASEVARACQVTPQTVNKYIRMARAMTLEKYA